MSQLSASEVSGLAQLARLALTAEELESMSQDLPRIVEFYQAIESAALDQSQPPLAQALETLRPDEPGSGPAGLTIKQLLQQAPEFNEAKGQVVVPAVFSND